MKKLTEIKKSKVKVYKTILDALKSGHIGQVFSTTGANRLYVITKHKWGKSSAQRVGDKIAKGFSPKTIPSSFRDVKGFATRTMVRHGKKAKEKAR